MGRWHEHPMSSDFALDGMDNIIERILVDYYKKNIMKLSKEEFHYMFEIEEYLEENNIDVDEDKIAEDIKYDVIDNDNNLYDNYCIIDYLLFHNVKFDLSDTKDKEYYDKLKNILTKSIKSKYDDYYNYEYKRSSYEEVKKKNEFPKETMAYKYFVEDYFEILFVKNNDKIPDDYFKNNITKITNSPGLFDCIMNGEK